MFERTEIEIMHEEYRNQIISALEKAARDAGRDPEIIEAEYTPNVNFVVYIREHKQQRKQRQRK